MWKSILINEINYIYLTKSEDNCLTLSLSDLKCIWSEKLPSSEILSRFKEMNPSFESNENIKDTVLSIVDNIGEALEVQVQSEDDIAVLTLRSQLNKSYRIGFKFVLNKLSVENFFSEITAPMVHTILYLEKEKHNLCDVIKKKDRELFEYKHEKGEISRGDLKTEPFVRTEKIEENDALMLNLFVPSFVPQNISENIKSESDQKSVQNDDSVKARPMKRKIYSAKTCTKKYYY